ncbi:MAG: N-acetylglucosamine-6-phosphate deacetylase [Clostridia bacterium]|nr:N-acetylglucosamine-6-phosphate deacetylase [Clostridia bacterium]
MLIKNGLVLNSNMLKFYENDVLIRDGKIIDIGKFDNLDEEIIDAKNDYVIPSFIDIHTHGAMGEDFLTVADENFDKLLKHYENHATKTIYATTVTAPHETIVSAVKRIAVAAKRNNKVKIEGIHVEGPYISTACPGCHMISEIRKPNLKELDDICEAADGLKLRITVAPEEEGAEEFIKEAVKRGINIGIGHSNADAETVKKAFSWGSNVMIHLFNAMSPLHHRKAGCVGIALASDVFTELIVDGKHVNPDVVALTFKVKGAKELVLITDSMQAASMPDGEYEIGGVKVTKENDMVKTKEGALAGSILNLLDAVKNLTNFTTASLAEAVVCASLNPAKVVGIDDVTGSIEVGKRADIAILDSNLSLKKLI